MSSLPGVLANALRLTLVLAACVFLPSLLVIVHGQAPARLAGVVRDGSGAVVPAATIVLRGPGADILLESGRDGAFESGPLAPGSYLVTIVAPGFGVRELEVTLPVPSPLDVTLSPAAVVEEVRVVSGSRQAELRESLNTRVDVVTRARIQSTGAVTVGEVLRELPGVVSRRGSEAGGAAGQQVQGLDSRQVAVLQDGQPIPGARGIKRGVVNLDRQSVNRLDRVEVVKGASSALFGSDALGGVINLITREITSPLETGGELSGGSFGEMNAVVDAGFRAGRWSGLGSVERHQQDGFDLTPTTFDTTGAPFQRTDYYGRVRAQLTPMAALSAIVTGYDNDTQGRSNGELGPQEDQISDATRNLNTVFDWLPAAATSVQARVYVASYEESSTGRLAPPLSTPVPPGALDQRLVKTDASVSHVIGTRQQLQGGTEYWQDEYSGINRLRNDPGERASMGTGWAQYRLTLADRVTATLGGRVDAHSQFGTAVSPKVAMNARVLEGLSVRASYGRGFRAPDIGQLYYRFLNPTNFYQVIGNPDLRAEYSNSIQVGSEFATSGRRTRFGLNVFRNDVTDLIDSLSLGMVATPAQLDALIAREHLDPTFRPLPGRLLLTYRNVNDALTRGVELDGDIAIVRNLTLSGAYTYLQAFDERTGLELTGRHPHQGYVRAAWQTERSGTQATLRGMFYSSWVAARTTPPSGGAPIDTIAPGFQLWDVFVSQRVLRALNAFVAVDNLFDNQDPNTGVLSPAGTPQPIYRPEAGRTFRFGVRWAWTR